MVVTHICDVCRSSIGICKQPEPFFFFFLFLAVRGLVTTQPQPLNLQQQPFLTNKPEHTLTLHQPPETDFTPLLGVASLFGPEL